MRRKISLRKDLARIDSAVGELQQVMARGYFDGEDHHASVLHRLAQLENENNRRWMVRVRRLYARLTYRLRLWYRQRKREPAPSERSAPDA